MARYQNKWKELPPPRLNPRRWGFDPNKGWRHEVSPVVKQAYISTRLDQLALEEGPLKEEDEAWLLDDQAFVPRELLQEIEEEVDSESDVEEMSIEEAFAALTV